MAATHFDGAESVQIVDRIGREGPAAYGREVLLEAFDEIGVATSRSGFWQDGGPLLVMGTLDDPLTRNLLIGKGVHVQPGAEGVVSARCDTGDTREALVLSGTDETGLMYGLLEAAGRLRAGGIAALDSYDDAVEYPDHAVRGVYRFIMGPLDNEWYDSVEFWRYYFARLASSRFNRLVLVMGFDTGYLSPPYPFFVEAKKYPAVRAAGLTTKDRAANLTHLNEVITLAHHHGIEFILGSWQQTPWVKEEGLLVENLPVEESELADYCAEGLKELLVGLPALDGIHFRVNHEAGVGSQRSNEAFWRKMVQSVAEVRPDIKLELRAKGLTDSMISDALHCGMKLTVPTKYWCEHAGLPHHLTQMRAEELTQLENFNHSRRYSYADMLRHPRPYDLVYRLWNNGTTSIFLWSDPDYVRRFVASCRLGSAAGYEVSAPLALQWGHAALQNEAWPLFAEPSLRSGRWEDERYWLFYTLFGRIGYNEQESPEVWEREIRLRYPAEAVAGLRDAHGSSGKILPLVTAFHMPVHPQLAYWPEVSTGAALFVENNHRNYTYMRKEMDYASCEPSDPGLFYGIVEWVDDMAAGRVQPKYSPMQVSGWLAELSATTQRAVAELDRVEGIEAVAEYGAARLDFLMLAGLALFHAHKIRAAVDLCRYQDTAVTSLLRSSSRNMERALEVWRGLSERAEGKYHENLVFQAGGMTGGRTGHWKDWLSEVEADTSKLQSLVEQASTSPAAADEPPQSAAMSTVLATARAIVPKKAAAGDEITVELVDDPTFGRQRTWTLLYRHSNQLEGPFRSCTMVSRDRGFRAVIPADYVTREWDILLYFACVSDDGHAEMVPGLFSSEQPMPYYVIEVR